METIETIKNLSDKQIEIAFITLGVFFNKADFIGKPSEGFEALSNEGIVALLDIDINFKQEFTVGQIKDLLKVEMLKRGIQ